MEYRGKNRNYAISYRCLEVLNMLILIVNGYTAYRLIGPQLLSYGIDSLKYLKGQLPDDPSNVIFPFLVKCVFNKHGFSGSHQAVDTVCVLVRMKFVDKVYLFLSFWWSILTFASLLATGLLLLQISKEHRGFCLWLGTDMKLSIVIKVTKKLSYGDYFLLTVMKDNLDTMTFDVMMEKLAAMLHI